MELNKKELQVQKAKDEIEGQEKLGCRTIRIEQDDDDEVQRLEAELVDLKKQINRHDLWSQSDVTLRGPYENNESTTTLHVLQQPRNMINLASSNDFQIRTSSIPDDHNRASIGKKKKKNCKLIQTLELTV